VVVGVGEPTTHVVMGYPGTVVEVLVDSSSCVVQVGGAGEWLVVVVGVMMLVIVMTMM